MRVVHVPCGPFANASELKAFNSVDQEIRRQSGEGAAYILTNLTHPNLRGQADEIDMVVIGPGGAVVIEVKHWDASALRRPDLADPAAELIVAKSKRIAGRLRSADQTLGFVAPAFLLTRETGTLKKNGTLPRHAMGVIAYGLKDVLDLVADAASAGQTNARRLADLLAVRYNLADAGRLKRLGRFDELRLLTDEHDRFQRIFTARDPWTGDRVLLHTYDLSAAPSGEAASLTDRRARREFDVVQRFQKSPHLPSLVDTWQPVPNYAGEMYFFSVSDSAATPVSALGDTPEWASPQRRDFALRALSALREFIEAEDGPLLHRALDGDSLRVRADNSPLFAGWRWARLTPAQTVSAEQLGDLSGGFAAPEVVAGGLTAATPKSDVYSLCAVLARLFTDPADEDFRTVILLGCDRDPARRPGVDELLDLLEESAADHIVASHTPEPAGSVSPSRWDEGHSFQWKNGSYRVISVLGQGSIARTFKLEQLDASGEPIGTFVGKAVFNAEFGHTSLAAYQRMRTFSLHPGLSNILECASGWSPDALTALLRWSQGSPLSAWRGDLDFIAQEGGADTTEQLAVEWFEKLCEALHELHAQGWVHGDVSLSNILVDESKVILIDYDLSGPEGHSPPSSGTPLYASPERRDGAVALARDDVYSLAASLYHAITDRPPAHSTSGSGLDWSKEERAAFPSLIPILDQATGSSEARYSDAGAALAALRAGRVSTASPIPAIVAAQPALRPNVVPRVRDILSTYPGSRFGNAETRGLDSDFAFDTYVPTGLDEMLPAEIRAGEVSLVILCGNAGDGKTAFLQRLVQTLGGDPPQSSERVWSGSLAGRKAMINLDGAASWKGRSADSLLDELFAPFLDHPPRDGSIHLVAVNDGRLMEWIEQAEAGGGERPLTLALTAALTQRTAGLAPHIRLVELNNRSLVGGLDSDRGMISTRFVDELIRRLVGGDRAAEIWAPCRTCTAQARCAMRRSADMMGASPEAAVLAGGTRVRERLTEALQTVHQRNEIHITARELKAAVSYVLFGLHDCEDLHRNAELEPHDPADHAFNPESPGRQGELLRELARLDPALEGHARVDRYLVGKGAPHPAHGASRFRDVVGRPVPLRDARRRAYLSWSADQVQAVGGDDHALTLRDGRRASEFRRFPLLYDAEQARIKGRLCNGLSRLEALPDLAYRDVERVPIRVLPRTPTETAFWIEKSASRFSLAPERFQPMAGLETLHRFLVLRYEPDHGGVEELLVPLELYSLLMDLADGVQILDAFSDDVFANLGVFTSRLAQEDERRLNAWNPVDSDVVRRLGVADRGGLQTIFLSSETA
ncbi:NERD domain-containing protein kinase family protein [Sphingomonas sp. PB4P5]|uniref:NERD domain-containing protein kinase family protein n=1 Tax=Parasphingomonas puruogangriensis TaxID=3096155 RepID=UPI002FCBAC4F